MHSIYVYGAKPEELHALYQGIVTIVEGIGAVVGPLTFGHTSIDHKLMQEPVAEAPSTVTGEVALTPNKSYTEP